MKTLNFTNLAKLVIDDIGSFLFNGKLFSSGDEVATKVDLESYQDISGAGQPYGYATLDMEGEIPSSQLPALAKHSVSIVQTLVERDAIDYQLHGDKCFVIDTGETFIWDENVPSWRLQAETQFEDITLTWDSIADKPLTFAPANHGNDAHAHSYYTDGSWGHLAGLVVDSAIVTDVETNDVAIYRDASGGTNANPYTFVYEAPRDFRLFASGGAGNVMIAKQDGTVDFFGDVFSNAKKLATEDRLFSGSYNDLSDKPVLFSGNYSDLSDKPSLFSGNYSDLSGIPSTFTPSSHSHKTLNVPDTRDLAETPNELMDRLGKGVGWDFKRKSTINYPPIGASSIYAHILNVVGWGDSSGGYPSQVSFGREGIAVRQGTGTSSWSSWMAMVGTTRSGGFEIRKNGSDGSGVINFKT